MYFTYIQSRNVKKIQKKGILQQNISFLFFIFRILPKFQTKKTLLTGAEYLWTSRAARILNKKRREKSTQHFWDRVSVPTTKRQKISSNEATTASARVNTMNNCTRVEYGRWAHNDHSILMVGNLSDPSWWVNLWHGRLWAAFFFFIFVMRHVWWNLAPRYGRMPHLFIIRECFGCGKVKTLKCGSKIKFEYNIFAQDVIIGKIIA